MSRTNLWCPMIKWIEIIIWILFIPIEKRTLILKMAQREVFLIKPKPQFIILVSRFNLWCPIIKRIEITMWIRVYPNWKTNFNSQNGTKRSFSYEIKASIRLSQLVESICGAQWLKESRLLCEFAFILIKKRTLILKMAQSEFFLMKPKPQFFYPNE